MLILYGESAHAARPHILVTPPGTRFLRESVNKFIGHDYPEVISVSGQHNQRIVHFFAAGSGDMIIHGGPLDIFDQKAMKKAFPKVNGKLPQHDIAEFVVGVVVNSRVPVKSLTVEELGKICTGDITNWNQVGGPDKKIILVGKDLSSNQGTILRELCFENKQCRRAGSRLPSSLNNG